MKILIVEDDSEYVQALQQDIFALNAYANFTVASSRDSAIARIRDSFFDLIFLDLKLPTIDGAVDEEPEHGHAVFALAREIVPGTPIFVLTGSPAEPFIDKLTAHTQQIDIWGTGQLPTVQFLAKFKYGTLFKTFAAPYLTGFNSIFDVELDRGGVALTPKEDRLVRIFSRRSKAVKCVVRQLSGGLSGVKVLRLKLTDLQGAPIYDCVCKLGSREAVFDENKRFNEHISRLDPKATPRKLDVLEFAAGDTCGIFYGLAAGYESDAFAIARLNDGSSQTMITNLEVLTAPWRAGLPQNRKLIGEIRAAFISNQKFNLLRGAIPHAWIEEFERRLIQVATACGHGDLHGSNVLVSQHAVPILIDYGDVGPCAACVDALTLELSLFFHVDGPLKSSTWPSAEEAADWGNLDAYLINSPMPQFIRACRDWAIRSAAGNREIAAVGYSYLARQLKYPDANRERIYALMDGVKRFFDVAT